MSYYRPTTEDIRASYEGDEGLLASRPWDESMEEAEVRLGRQFDEWLAQIKDEQYRAGRTDGALFGELKN